MKAHLLKVETIVKRSEKTSRTFDTKGLCKIDNTGNRTHGKGGMGSNFGMVGWLAGFEHILFRR